MRVENWESQFQGVLHKLLYKGKFKHGKNDCVTFVIENIEAITGKKVFNKKYKNLKEARKIIKNYKQTSLLTIALQIAKDNNFKEIDINRTQRGDVLYYIDKRDLDGTLGVCIGDKVMFNWQDGITIVEKEKCIKGWRIE